MAAVSRRMLDQTQMSELAGDKVDRDKQLYDQMGESNDQSSDEPQKGKAPAAGSTNRKRKSADAYSMDKNIRKVEDIVTSLKKKQKQNHDRKPKRTNLATQTKTVKTTQPDQEQETNAHVETQGDRDNRETMVEVSGRAEFDNDTTNTTNVVAVTKDTKFRETTMVPDEHVFPTSTTGRDGRFTLSKAKKNPKPKWKVVKPAKAPKKSAESTSSDPAPYSRKVEPPPQRPAPVVVQYAKNPTVLESDADSSESPKSAKIDTDNGTWPNCLPENNSRNSSDAIWLMCNATVFVLSTAVIVTLSLIYGF